MLYRLTHEPAWCPPWSPGVPSSYRIYRNGQPFASRGIFVPGHLPAYPTHEAAIRATLEQRPMPDTTHHRPLSVAEVLDLRVNARAHTYDSGGASGVAALSITYNLAADMYELRTAPVGPPVTAHRDIAAIGALVRAERLEPGFIRRVLDPSYVPDELALDADARERARAQRAAQEARTRAQRAEAEERAREARRVSGGTIDAPPDLSVDDLFDTL